MTDLGYSMHWQSPLTVWYADVLYKHEVLRLNRFPYFKPHLPSLDSQASTSFPRYYFLADFDHFLL
jgi:hypothetical protein